MGSNISTVALRVVGGDKKGSLESGTVKYGRESHGTWFPRMNALARASSNCKWQTAGVHLRKNSGRESQGTRRRDELIGGKPPVIK
jgi:hypothetical protein